MTAATCPPSLQLPRKQDPSARDRAIWLAIVVERRLQREVATEFGVTQPRVAQIVRRVGEWVNAYATPEMLAEISPNLAQAVATYEAGPLDAPADSVIGPDEEAGVEPFEAELPMGLAPAARLRLAEFVVLERLEYIYGQALDCFRHSQANEETNTERTVGEETVRVKVIKTRDGKVSFLSQAQRAAVAIARLHGVDLTGKSARKRAEEEEQLEAVQADKLAPPVVSPAAPEAAASSVALPTTEQTARVLAALEAEGKRLSAQGTAVNGANTTANYLYPPENPELDAPTAWEALATGVVDATPSAA